MKTTFTLFALLLLNLTSKSQVYCIPVNTNGCSQGDNITNVTFNTINRNSVCDTLNNGGYSIWSGTSLVIGNSYLLSVSTGPFGNQGIKAWIDYNLNGVFESNEVVLSTPSMTTNTSLSYAQTVTIPFTAVPGPSRLRVRTRYGQQVADSEPCNTFFYGETEDYSLNILGTVTDISNVEVEKQGIFPNPVNLGDEFQLPFTKNLLEVVAMNMTGEIFKLEPMNGSGKYSTRNLNPGQYIINARNELGINWYKLLIY